MIKRKRTHIKDSCEATTGRKRLDHDIVQSVIDDMSRLLEVDRVDNFVVPIRLVSVQIFRLATMAGIW